MKYIFLVRDIALFSPLSLFEFDRPILAIDRSIKPAPYRSIKITAQISSAIDRSIGVFPIKKLIGPTSASNFHFNQPIIQGSVQQAFLWLRYGCGCWENSRSRTLKILQFLMYFLSWRKYVRIMDCIRTREVIWSFFS